MQTTRAILYRAGRVLVALSFRNPGVANIAGKEMTVAHIYDPRSGGHSRVPVLRVVVSPEKWDYVGRK